MRLWQTILVYLFLCIGVCWAMRKQGVAVRGVLKCGAVPSNYSKVRIVDIDYGPDPDDTLDEKRTDERGRFEVSGTTHEMTPIDPVMYIWHECRDEQTNKNVYVSLTNAEHTVLVERIDGLHVRFCSVAAAESR
ncbi:hypothetical protein Y032_0255g323 [Ancylostoma ceylanicum]|nr:hypothetical protein Y032_0255g323 [Ancylostoma ceylanicum]